MLVNSQNHNALNHANKMVKRICPLLKRTNAFSRGKTVLNCLKSQKLILKIKNVFLVFNKLF